MASDLTYRLSQLQVTPPPAAWKQIRARLDEEYDVHETHLAMKLDAAEFSPPASVWENIQSALYSTSVRQPVRVIAMPYKRLAAAAAFIGMIGFAAWYFIMFGSGTTDASAVTAAVSTTITPKKGDQPAPEVKKPANKIITPLPAAPSTLAVNTNLPAIIRPIPSRQKPGTGKPSPSKRMAAYSIAPVLPDGPIVIDAPPIRDEQGNIVMDAQLLKAADDDRYIIVTSPNGQQTRISEKFLNILQYLHAQDEDYIGPDIYQRHLWKQRILEWKNKLIHSAGFIPSNNNFLGIMDLKELVQQEK